MNIRQALAHSPVQQAIRDEGNALRIIVTRRASENYEVVITLGETVHLSETVIDERAVELLLWEHLRMQSILFEPAQALTALVPVQVSSSPSAIEQLAAEHKLGTLLKSYKERRAGNALIWLILSFSILLLYGNVCLVFNPTEYILVKIVFSLFMLPTGLLLLVLCFTSLWSFMRINSTLRGIKDEICSNYQTLLLYEHGLICNKWVESDGTWNNNSTVVSWDAVSYLQSSKTIQQSGTTTEFAIKTKDGHTVDISLGGQELATAIEKHMNARFVSTA